MRHTLFFLLGCSTLLLHAQAPNTEWLRTAGGFSQYIPYRSAIDANGRIYTAGSGAALDYGSGTIVADQGFAIARYSPAGDILWARTLASPPFQDESVTGIATNSGSDLWVTGSFTSSTLTLDAFTLVNTGVSSAFLARFDSTGVAEFAISWGGTTLSSTSAMDVCTDGLDNVYVTGSSDASSLTIDGVTMTNTAGGQQLITLRFDAGGTAVWGTMSTSPLPGANGLCIAADKLANAYVTARFDDALVIADDTLSTLVTDHVALIKFTSTGAVGWMHAVAVCDPLDMAVDGDGNTYVCGDIQYTADFDGDTLVPSVLDGFVSAYGSAGAHRWVTAVHGDIDNELCWSVALDSAQTSLVVGGTFVFSAWFGDEFVETGIAPTDGFVMHMDTTGEVNWVKDMTGDGPTLFAEAHIDNAGHIYASGTTQSMMSYLGEPVLNASGNQAFLARFGEVTTELSFLADESAFLMHPNPTAGTFTLHLPADTRMVVIDDALGRTQQRRAVDAGSGSSFVIDRPGLFFVNVITATGRSVQKIVVD